MVMRTTKEFPIFANNKNTVSLSLDEIAILMMMIAISVLYGCRMCREYLLKVGIDFLNVGSFTYADTFDLHLSCARRYTQIEYDSMQKN